MPLMISTGDINLSSRRDAIGGMPVSVVLEREQSVVLAVVAMELHRNMTSLIRIQYQGVTSVIHYDTRLKHHCVFVCTNNLTACL